MADRYSPQTMDEWMRDVEKRLRAVERHRHPAPTFHGWRLTTNDDGDLVARPPGGDGSNDVVLAPAPP